MGYVWDKGCGWLPQCAIGVWVDCFSTKILVQQAVMVSSSTCSTCRRS